MFAADEPKIEAVFVGDVAFADNEPKEFVENKLFPAINGIK